MKELGKKKKCNCSDPTIMITGEKYNPSYYCDSCGLPVQVFGVSKKSSDVSIYEVYTDNGEVTELMVHEKEFGTYVPYVTNEVVMK